MFKNPFLQRNQAQIHHRQAVQLTAPPLPFFMYNGSKNAWHLPSTSSITKVRLPQPACVTCCGLLHLIALPPALALPSSSIPQGRPSSCFQFLSSRKTQFLFPVPPARLTRCSTLVHPHSNIRAATPPIQTLLHHLHLESPSTASLQTCSTLTLREIMHMFTLRRPHQQPLATPPKVPFPLTPFLCHCLLTNRPSASMLQRES